MMDEMTGVSRNLGKRTEDLINTKKDKRILR